MNRHDFLQFNPHSYKRYLSAFGRNVLDTLIRHKRTGFDNTESRRHHQLAMEQNRRNIRDYHPTSRRLVFRPSSPINRSHDSNDVHHVTQAFDHFPLPSTLLNQTKPNNRLLCGGGAHDALPTAFIPSSVELLKTVDIADTNDDEILTANDIIPPVIQFTKKTRENFISSKKYDNNIGIPPVKFLENLNNENNNIIAATDKVLKSRGNDTDGKNVDWCDMFDLALFPESNCPETLIRLEKQDNNKSLQIRFPKDVEKCKKRIDQSKATIIEIANIKDNKTCKRKNQKKITDTISKKVKKTYCNQDGTENLTKNTLRKINYTKAVQNWLDDADPNNLVQGEILLHNHEIVEKVENLPAGTIFTQKEEINDEITEMTKTKLPSGCGFFVPFPLCGDDQEFGQNTSTEIEEKITEKVKKVIEVRVAHKDPSTKASKSYTNLRDDVDSSHIVEDDILKNIVEKMQKENLPTAQKEKMVSKTTRSNKVKPPIEIEKKAKKVIQARLAQKDGKMKFKLPTKEQEGKTEPVIDNQTKSKDTLKEKKIKPKFVAPIKSQIPVKNMTFDVHTIDKTNAQLINKVFESENDEIVMILIYRHGFCQLNMHHTEETCVPEGIMIQLNYSYFYLKGDNIEHGNLIMELLQKVQVICYNGKQLLMYLIVTYNIEDKQCSFNMRDTKIGGSLINPDDPPENFTDLQKLLGHTPEFTIATDCVLQKAAWYITLLRECFSRLKSLLIENTIWNLFVHIETPLLPVIAGMEYRGVSVDLEKLKQMEDILLTKIKAVEQECYKAAGKTFQINSTLQVRTILYDELQLDTKSNLKIKETIGKGAKSTSETMLRGLVCVHPLPKLILEYRHLHKAHATFLTGIAQHVKDGFVKPTWVQTAAATGRIASNNPNLQAIPKAPFSLVMFPDDAFQEPPLNFRSVYTSRPLHTLLAADFKHIECRVFAHAAADATLLDALRSGRDLFRVLAAKWLKKPDAEISNEDRERTKRIVYASLYGAGARKLMEILQVDYDQALSIASSFNRTFPALKAFGRATVARASTGALRSLCGRTRRFPHIASADFALRSHAERQTINFAVQGSAADLCKKAMVLVARRLQAERVAGRLVLQIHDELVWEVPGEHLERAAVIIKEVMENIGYQCGMAMTLPVEMSSGRNWGEMKQYPPS